MKNKFDELLSDIIFDENHIAKVMEKIEKEGARHSNKNIIPIRKKSSKKLTTLLIAAALIIGLTGFAFALELPQKLAQLAGEYFRPINQSVVDQDIELTVLGAISDNEMGEIYFTLRDLKGNRISEKTSLSSTVIGSNITGTSLVDFDKEQGLSTYKSSVHGVENLKGKTLRLHIDSLTETNELTKDTFDLNLYEVVKNSKPIEFVQNHMTYWNAQNSQATSLSEQIKDLDIKIPPEEDLSIIANNTPWYTIKKIGYADGLLYVKILKDEDNRNERGYLFLENEDKEEMKYPVLRRSSAPNDYDEYIIEIKDIQNLHNLNLAAYVSSDGDTIKGSWYTSFKLEGVDVKTINCDIDIDGGNVKSLDLSPLGIVLRGESQLYSSNPYDKLSIKVEFTNSSTTLNLRKPNNTTKANDKLTGRWELPYNTKIKDIKKIIIGEKQLTIK